MSPRAHPACPGACEAEWIDTAAGSLGVLHNKGSVRLAVFQPCAGCQSRGESLTLFVEHQFQTKSQTKQLVAMSSFLSVRICLQKRIQKQKKASQPILQAGEALRAQR